MNRSEEIVKNFEPLIKAYIKKYYANNKSYEDAYQDGMLKLLELIEKYNGNGKVSLECYLKYQIKYFYMDKYAKEKRESSKIANNVHTLDDGTTEDIFESIADEFDIYSDFEKREEYKIIYRAIDELTERQKSVVIMKFFKNMKNREIADKLKLSEDTVKEHYSIAKKKLRKFFEEIKYERF